MCLGNWKPKRLCMLNSTENAALDQQESYSGRTTFAVFGKIGESAAGVERRTPRLFPRLEWAFSAAAKAPLADAKSFWGRGVGTSANTARMSACATMLSTFYGHLTKN
jgi:hypothetical protein